MLAGVQEIFVEDTAGVGMRGALLAGAALHLLPLARPVWPQAHGKTGYQSYGLVRL